MPAAPARPCSASVSTLPNTMSGCACEAASNTGANCRHGPHQDAQKSTSTMSLSSTAVSKVPAVNATVAMGHILGREAGQIPLWV